MAGVCRKVQYWVAGLRFFLGCGLQKCVYGCGLWVVFCVLRAVVVVCFVLVLLLLAAVIHSFFGIEAKHDRSVCVPSILSPTIRSI